MDRWTRGLMEFDPQDYLPSNIKTPTAEELLDGFNPPSWLVEKARQLESLPHDMDQVEMVGLIGRLASAACSDPKAVLKSLLDGKGTPGSRAREWAKSLSKEETNRIWNFVDDEVEICLQRLDDDVIDPHSPSELQAFCEAREEIACLNWVLEMAGDPYDLLSFLDRRAKEENISPSYTEHLSSVGWQEPQAWWGYREVEPL